MRRTTKLSIHNKNHTYNFGYLTKTRSLNQLILFTW